MADLPIPGMPLPVAITSPVQPLPAPVPIAPGPTAAADIGLLLKQGRSNSSSIADEWLTLLADKRSVGEVADELRAGSLKGTSQEYLTRKITEVMDKTDGNAAQAAAIIKASLGGQSRGIVDDVIQSMTFGLPGKVSRLVNDTPRLSNGQQIDNEKLQQYIKEAKIDPVTGSSALEVNAVAQAGRERSRGDLMTAQAAAEQATRLRAAAQAELQKGDLRMNMVLPRLEEAEILAQQQLAAVQAKINPPPVAKAKPQAKPTVPVQKVQPPAWIDPNMIFANTH